MSRTVLTPVLLLALIGCSKSEPRATVVEADAGVPAVVAEPAETPLESWVRYMSVNQDAVKQEKAIGEILVLKREHDVDPVPALVNALDDRRTHGPGMYFPGRPGSTREAAVMALLKLGAHGEAVLDTRVVPKLVAGLSDRDPAVREHSAYALGLLDERAEPARGRLTELTADDKAEVRTAAYRVLEDLGPELDTSEAIVALLGHEDEDIRRDAALALNWLEVTPSMVTDLIGALKDENATVRYAATDALGRLGGQARPAISELIGLVRSAAESVDPSDPHGPRDLAALSVLIRIGGPAVPELSGLLRDPNPFLRWWGAQALASIGPDAREALPALKKLMDEETMFADVSLTAAVGQVTIGEGDADVTKGAVEYAASLVDQPAAGVRRSAVLALGAMGKPAESAVPKIVQALKDDEEEVRKAAMWSLRSMGSAAAPAVPALAVQLTSDDAEVSRTAAEILADIGPAAADAAEELGEVVADPSQDRDVRRLAVRTLASLGEKGGAAAGQIVRGLQDAKAPPDLRAEFAEALAEIPAEPGEVVPALIAALAERDATIKLAAIRSLGRVGEPARDAIPALTELVEKGYSMGHRLAAIEALGRIGPAAEPTAEPLVALLERSPGDPRRLWAAAALAGIRPDRAGEYIPVLREELGHAARPGREKDRAEAMRAVEMVGPAAGPLLRQLREALRSDSDEVRLRAVRALAEVGGANPETVNGLLAVLADPEPEVRRAAVRELGRFGAEARPAVGRLRELARSDESMRPELTRAVEAIEADGAR